MQLRGSKAYVWMGGKWDGTTEGCASSRWREKLNTELQCVSFTPIPVPSPSCLRRAPVCLSAGPEGEQSCSLCFPYLQRGDSPCGQLSRCVFGVRCEHEPAEACVFLCHGKVYRIPWNMLWSGHVVDIQQKQWLSAVFDILHKPFAFTTCV